jgi:hypothetical protein
MLTQYFIQITRLMKKKEDCLNQKATLFAIYSSVVKMLVIAPVKLPSKLVIISVSKYK